MCSAWGFFVAGLYWIAAALFVDIARSGGRYPSLSWDCRRTWHCIRRARWA